MELLCNNSKLEHPINNFKYIIYNGNIKVGDIFEEYDNLYYIKSEYLTNNSSEGYNNLIKAKYYVSLEDLDKDDFEYDIKLNKYIGICEVTNINNIKLTN